ncbi:MAG: DUF1254 domain-containing protein [Pseudomonadota bacterium]
MRRWLGPLAALILTAMAAHWATLAYAPRVIMDRALSTLKDRGIAQHAFTTPRRITPQTQAVVRSSPDLFYSLCRYDLSEPGSSLKVTMSAWPDYQSLSFFDDETNNFLVLRPKSGPVEMELVIGGKGSETPGRITTSRKRGVVLIRRLAPTQELFDAAMEVAEGDVCELVRP